MPTPEPTADPIRDLIQQSSPTRATSSAIPASDLLALAEWHASGGPERLRSHPRASAEDVAERDQTRADRRADREVGLVDGPILPEWMCSTLS